MEGTRGECQVVRCSKAEERGDVLVLRLSERSSLRSQRSTVSTDVVRRQNMSNLCERGGTWNHPIREHISIGLPIDTGVLGSTSIWCSCFGVGTYDRSEMGDSCLTGAAGFVPVREVLDLSSCRE